MEYQKCKYMESLSWENIIVLLSLLSAESLLGQIVWLLVLEKQGWLRAGDGVKGCAVFLIAI